MPFRVLGPDDPALVALDAALQAHPDWSTTLLARAESAVREVLGEM